MKSKALPRIPSRPMRSLVISGVLDRHSRRLLGLAFGTRMDASLPEAALRQALARRGGGPRAGL